MSLPRYPKYKDSGAAWLGEVPEHWQIEPLKYSASLKGRLGWQGLRSDEYTEDGPFLVTSEHFTNDRIDWPRCYHISPDRYAMAPEIQLRHGDLLMMKDGAAMGKLAFVDELPGPACLNSHLLLFRPLNGRFENLFLYFLLGGPGFKTYMTQERTGTTFFGLSQEKIGAFPFAIPPISEQHSILKFVSGVVLKVDALVEEQRRLIELLKEKRQTVISHAVTKGLNPDARMRDSGIEWIGQVPKHWEMVPLRWKCDCRSGESIEAEAVSEIASTENPVPVIGGNGVMGYTRNGNVANAALAIGRVGALCGNVHQVSPPAWITDNALVLNVDTETFDLSFVSQLLGVRNLNDIASKTAQPLITGTQLKDQRLPCAPMTEQLSITAHVKRETAKFRQLAAEATHAIGLLQERRTALISAAVTGKIDVRGLAKENAA